MFTGLIQSKAKLVKRAPRGNFGECWSFQCEELTRQLKEGDSIALNGVCLTALRLKDGIHFEAELSPETLEKTSLREITEGTELNAELPATPQSFLGGHWVQGHVDGVATIASIESLGGFFHVKIEMPEALMRYMIPKGSVAIDGISLTINGLSKNEVDLMIIPKTWEKTNLGGARVGQKVNVEADSFVKTIEHFWIQSQAQFSGVHK
jgi:riboflavin synthase